MATALAGQRQAAQPQELHTCQSRLVKCLPAHIAGQHQQGKVAGQAQLSQLCYIARTPAHRTGQCAWSCQRGLLDTQSSYTLRVPLLPKPGFSQQYKITHACSKWPACQASGGPKLQADLALLRGPTLQVSVSLL